ncbi:MAG TPA: ADP-ribosylglycohydrolase family protein [Kofleriaceae bacterium]|nr:ADP-ribosylglycohydrolase family protein [Kofleriaceae bacterium]
MTIARDRARGALLGLAVGDALGTTYEFERLDQPPYPALATGPATDVVGGGPFDLAAGCVTDDTQMAVCLATSLAAHGQLDIVDLGARYVAWSQHAFDIGVQTGAALGRIERGESPELAGRSVWIASGRQSAGNGSLMRTAPLAVHGAGTPHRAWEVMAESMITHADPRCVFACASFDAAIAAYLAGADAFAAARAALAASAVFVRRLWHADPADDQPIRGAESAIAADLERAKTDDPGFDRSGFVRTAFRLAFWHAHHTASWRDAVVDVASRGGDADTNAAITGALLGARDGAAAIPPAWIERVLAATLPGPREWADAHHPQHLLALADSGR